jgi:hypothetical protein
MQRYDRTADRTVQSVKALNLAASGAIRITVVRATPSSRAMAR